MIKLIAVPHGIISLKEVFKYELLKEAIPEIKQISGMDHEGKLKMFLACWQCIDFVSQFKYHGIDDYDAAELANAANAVAEYGFEDIMEELSEEEQAELHALFAVRKH